MMVSNFKYNTQYIPYKEILKQRSKEYYNKNKEMIKKKNKIKYDLLTPEDKKKRQDYRKKCYNNLPVEK